MMVFRSTLPQGERPADNGFVASAFAVSIHAPAGGATGRNPAASSAGRFRSTLPQGERPLGGLADEVAGAFRSTLPQGERLG